MRKRILILGLSAVCMFSFVACGNKETVMETTESTAENIVAENVEDTTASDETTTEEKKTTKKNTTEKVTKDDNKKTKEDSTTESARTNANNSSANSNAGTSRTTENGRTNVNSNSGNSNTGTSRTTESRNTTESRTENRTTEAPTTQHTHNWQPIIVHHEAEYEERVIPAVYNTYFCRTCGRSYPTDLDDPCLYSGQCITNGTSCQELVTPSRIERVLVRDAYDEVVGYRCSCGATK